LEREKVRYLSLEERQAYLVKVDGVCICLPIWRSNTDERERMAVFVGPRTVRESTPQLTMLTADKVRDASQHLQIADVK